MNKIYTINGGMFNEYKVVFADIDITRRALRAYANFLKFRGFDVFFIDEDSLSFTNALNKHESVWISEFPTAHELPSFLEEFATD